jgi:osmotically-inducible protein OsmY
MNPNRFLMAALVGAVLCSAAPVSAHEDQANWLTTLNVKLALFDKLGTDSLNVNVDSSAGNVVLRGTVSKRATKELAENVAESVDGVAEVDNELRVEAATSSQSAEAVGEAEAELEDATLETKIRIALIDKMGSDGFTIGTEAASGVVTLEFDRGLAADRRQLAIATVRGVGGVKKVVSVEDDD